MSQGILPETARIAKNSPLPRHHQVRSILQDLVVSGYWSVGDKLPAETDLADMLGVSKMTVNKAILALTADGVFVREVGRGTFVSGLPKTGDAFAVTQVRAAVPRIHVITSGALEYVGDNEYLCRLLLAMRACVSPTELQITLRQAHGPHYMPYWKEGRSEGWILIAPRRADVPGLRALGEAYADGVVVGASWHESQLSFVDSDNVQGAHLAISHLAELGHRQIALLYADPEASNTQDRLRGFREAMKVHTFPVREDWVLDVESDYLLDNAMRQRLRVWLGGADRPTAIFAAGPYIACAVLEAARDVGLRVPQDLSLVGFDDPAAFADASPAPTTIQQPLEEMGREAIQFLRRRIGAAGGPGETLRSVLPCTLLERASTAIARR